MKFCKNCGAERKEGQVFCQSCGHPFSQKMSQDPVPQTSYQPSTEQKHQQPKKPMSKKSKALLVSIVVLAGLGFGGHKYLESLYSPQKTVEAFVKAVQSEDLKQAEQVLDLSSFPEDVQDEQIKSYLAFLKKTQSDWSNELIQAAGDVENQAFFSNPVVLDNENELIQLTKADKKYGLYQQYKVKSIPFEVNIESNLAEVEINLLGKKEALKDNLTLKVLPGTYELIGNYKGEYVQLKETTELDFSEAEKNQLDAFLEFEGQYVDVYSNEEDSTLFVNGKSTGTKIGDSMELGPLQTDGSIVLHAEYEAGNGKVKSNQIKVMNSDDVYLEFDHLQENSQPVNASTEQNSIEEFMKQYIQTSINAMNEGDFSLVESFHAPEGKSYKESKDYIDYIVSKGIKEDLLSIEVIDYVKSEDGYLVNTNEEYDIHYSDGTSDRKKFASTYRLTQSKKNDFQLWALESTSEIE